MGLFDFGMDVLTGGGYGAARGQQEAAERSAEEMRQLREQFGGYYDPYISAGQGAISDYSGAIGAMADPQQFYSQMMQGYQTSPQAQLALEEGTRAATQGASASGMLGSGEMLKGLQQYGQQLTAADEQQWLQNMLGIYGGYTGGLSDIAGQGSQALGQYGQLARGQTSDIADLMAQAAQSRGEAGVFAMKPLQQAIGGFASGMSGGMGSAMSGAGSALLGLL